MLIPVSGCAGRPGRLPFGANHGPGTDWMCRRTYGSSHWKPWGVSGWNGRAPRAAVTRGYGRRRRILRQTVVAMLKGAVLAEHENPGEATVHVLSGRVRLAAGDVSWEGRPSDPLVVPDARHGPRPVKGAFRADRSRS